MSRPEDIPEEVWHAAEAQAMTYIDWLFNGGNPPDTDAEHVLAVTIAYAMLGVWNTRASPPSPAEVEWQSIETAPKDGTAIMLAGPWQGGFRRFIGRWGEHGWLEGEGGNGYYFPMHMQDFFAHWTPLPKPPTLSAGGRT